MEHLSVNTAIIGILAVGARLSESLWDLDANPGDESALLDLAVEEVKQCRSSIKLLHKTLFLAESAQLPYPERAAWIQIDHVVAILADVALALSDLQVTCEMHMQGSEVQAQIHAPTNTFVHQDASVREQCAKRIRALCSRLRWHNLSIAMLMTVLKCKADSDADNSSKGLEHRMTRLLSSNADLSGRMATLEDVFGAKPIASSPPPNPYHAISPASSPLIPPGADLYGSILGSVGPSRPSSPRCWSTFSGLTLADLPSPSAVAIPLTTLDLRHGNVFYTMAYARQASQDSGESLSEQSQQSRQSQHSQHNAAPVKKTPETITVPRNGPPSEKAADWSGFASKMKRLGLMRRDKKQKA